MGERFFRELTSLDDRRSAASDAIAWGFPREIDDDEVRGSFWFRLEDRLVFWFERVPGFTDLWLHLVVAPTYRYRWPVIDWIEAYQAAAIAKGAKRVRYQPFGDDRDGKVPEYLARIGWTSDALGPCKVLEAAHG